MWASELRLAAAPVQQFAEVADAFVQRGRQIMGYSGALSTANAMADVRGLMADIREAQDTGTDLARLTDSQSKATDDLKKILEPIKEALIVRFANLMEIVVRVLEASGEKLVAMETLIIKSVDLIAKILLDIWKREGDQLAKDVREGPGAIIEAAKEAVKKFRGDGMDFNGFLADQLDALHKQFGDLPGAPELPALPPGGGFGFGGGA